MDLRDIVKLPIVPYMSREIKRFRKAVPVYLAHVLEKTGVIETVHSLEKLGKNSVKILTSGSYSAVFFLKKEDHKAVIKLRPEGLFAEAEALEAWEKQGVRVSRVHEIGKLYQEGKVVPYMVQEAVEDRSGELAETAWEYALRHPERTFSLGRLMGHELAKMHRAESERTFGEYSDMSGKIAPYGSWEAYLIALFDEHKKFLAQVGVEKDTAERLREKILSIKFSSRRVYLHGDFSLRNALIEQKRPLALRIIDPNPLIGNPSWDLANRFTNKEVAWQRSALAPKNKHLMLLYKINRDFLKGMLEGYETELGRRFPALHILACHVVQLLVWYAAEYMSVKKKGEDIEKNTEVLAHKKGLLTKVARFLEAE